MRDGINYDALILKARGGDESAMTEIIESLMPSVEAVASEKECGGSATRHDLIQEGMLGVFNAVLSYDKVREASFATYARACVQNSIASAVRAQSRKKHKPLNSYVPLEDVELSDRLASSNPEAVVSLRDDVSNIMHCIDSDLTELERNVLKSRIAGKSHAQIAAENGISVKAAGNALSRARKKIRSARSI